MDIGMMGCLMSQWLEESLPSFLSDPFEIENIRVEIIQIICYLLICEIMKKIFLWIFLFHANMFF